ncbi:hypothetical protein [Pandoraea sputorum]|uniref:Uncharacterized protein n=1 Tax=Pandoraea sputorum TaxID=93222 RepID=A0A5E5BIV6_9BURK|nr:hypothetical protein [Pandoraea sputorum]VVE84975.1 hypothetical protein PSP31121_05022 [Pandoraea sputorum]
MSRQKKPRNKRYSPGRNRCGVHLRTEPWKVGAMLDPVVAVIDELEQQGTVNVDEKGRAIVRNAADGQWYTASDSIMGIVDAFEIHQLRCGRQMPLEPLRQLVRKLDVGMPLFDTDTVPARAALTVLRAEAMNMRADYARDLANTVSIQDKLNTAREAGAP